MNYAYGYYGANDFRNYSNSLMHFGRKGMKWGKSIFGDEVTSNAQRVRSQSQRNRFIEGMRANAAATRRQASTGSTLAKSAATLAIQGKGSVARAGAGLAAKSYGRAVGSAVKTAGYAAAYAANVVEEKLVTGMRMGYKALKSAASKTIQFGKDLIRKIVDKVKGAYRKVDAAIKKRTGYQATPSIIGPARTGRDNHIEDTKGIRHKKKPRYRTQGHNRNGK